MDSSVPLLGFIGRLDYQKGVDVICESYDWLMDQGVQLIMLGSGREDLDECPPMLVRILGALSTDDPGEQGK